MTTKDVIGQEISINDWCAITQRNQVFVGKVVSISSKGAVTIAIDSVDEYVYTNKAELNALDYKQKNIHMQKAFPKVKDPRWWNECSWARDNKFVKIYPTKEILLAYDKG
jgi:hypothetical protein